MQTSFHSYALTTTLTFVQLSNICHPLFKELLSHFFSCVNFVFATLSCFILQLIKIRQTNVTLEYFPSTKPVLECSPKEYLTVQLSESRYLPIKSGLFPVGCGITKAYISNYPESGFKDAFLLGRFSVTDPVPKHSPLGNASTKVPLSSS